MILVGLLLASGCAPAAPTARPPAMTPPFTLIPLLAASAISPASPLPGSPLLATPEATQAPTLTPLRATTMTATRIPTRTVTQTPAPLPPETIEFMTRDLVRLSGTYYRATMADTPLVVLVHQARGSQADWWEMGFVQYLRNLEEPYPLERFVPLPAGVHFSVFAFDLRGHGLSAGEYNPDKASQFMEDMRAALAVAGALPGVLPGRVAAVGSSTGSAVLFVCPGVCAGVMAISLYPTDAALRAIEKLDGQGAVVFCVSEFACPAFSSERYVTVQHSGAGHGYDLLNPALRPAPGEVFYDFLRLTFGFEPGS